LRNTISEDAVDFDEELLSMLLAEEKLKEHFFKKIGKAIVFDKDKFLTFVNNKNFLPDSYTKFTQNIGLTTDDDKFIKSSGKVVLNWPYKDCILEGGQTKEEKGRNEIFFNEILEKDEIDALLRPKAFTKFQKYTGKAGTGKIKEEKVKEFSRNEKGVIKDNLIIKGNNLLALHSLKEEFAGRVKLIYIDPPYNTGNDGFKYNDNFNHSTWLTFMKNRLEIARELLSDDGVIFVQCDDNEQAYLKVLMDEVFNYKFINCIAIKVSPANGVKISHATKKILKEKEYVLVYSKDKIVLNPQYVENLNWDSHYNYFIENKDKNINEWKVIKLSEKLKEQNLIVDLGDKKFERWMYKNVDAIFQTVSPPDKIKNNDKYQIEKIQEVKELKGYFACKGKQVHFLSKNIKQTLNGKKLSKLACDFWSEHKNL
jgi:adenine-specific DNA-methyltransferase